MDWVISAGILLNYFLLARRVRFGWITSFANNLLWAGYMGYQQQWGFVICGVILAGMAVYGWINWKGEIKSQSAS